MIALAGRRVCLLGARANFSPGAESRTWRGICERIEWSLLSSDNREVRDGAAARVPHGVWPLALQQARAGSTILCCTRWGLGLGEAGAGSRCQAGSSDQHGVWQGSTCLHVAACADRPTSLVACLRRFLNPPVAVAMARRVAASWEGVLTCCLDSSSDSSC